MLKTFIPCSLQSRANIGAMMKSQKEGVDGENKKMNQNCGFWFTRKGYADA
jgi:hypothetical protein